MLDFVNPARVGPGALHGESIVDPGGHPDLGKEIAMSRFVRAVAGHRAAKRQAQRGHPKSVSSRPVFVLLDRRHGCRAREHAAVAAAGRRRAGVGPMPQAGAAQPPSRFVAESRETLKRLQEKMAGLAARALAGLDQEIPADGDVASQSLMVESAKAGYQHAVLAREAAEIALKEISGGSSRQEKKSCETQIKLAQVELESARASHPASQGTLRQDSSRSKPAQPRDLARDWQFEAGEIVAQLQEKKAQFALEQARSKLDGARRLRKNENRA